jgi:ParB/RepB/Spo0J family partition protein
MPTSTGPLFLELKIDDLMMGPEFQFRTGALDVKSLAENIARNGQIVPVLTRALGDGRFQLLGGNRRVAALNLLGEKFVKALVLHAVSDRHATSVALAENIDREPLTDWDRVSAVLHLVNQGISKDEVAKEFSVTKRTVERFMVVANAPPEFSKALQSGDVSIHQAYEAIKRGVALAEITEGKRSVKFLRQVARNSASKQRSSPAIEAKLKFVPGKTSADAVIQQAQDFIRKVRQAAKLFVGSRPKPRRPVLESISI